MSLGTTTRRAIQVRLDAPLTSALDTRGEISAFQFDRDQSVFASSSESVSGLKATARVRLHKIANLSNAFTDLLLSQTRSPLGVHEFGYEAALRRIKDLTPAASARCFCSANPTRSR